MSEANNATHIRLRSKRCGGFSLVEMALALGVVAFALVPLMGLLPVAMSAHRDAIDTTVTAQIAQAVVGDLQQTPFADLDAAVADRLYFDDQGNPLEDATDAARLYDVRLSVVKSAEMTGPNAASTNLARVKIEIASNPGRVADPFSNTERSFVRYGYVADNL